MKFSKYFLPILAAVGLTACEMDREVYSEAPVGGYAKDAAGVNSLLMGAYGSMHDVLYYEWAMTELRSDNTRMRISGSNSSESKLIEQLDQNTLLSSHAWVDKYWTASYRAIACANDALASIGVVHDAALAAQYEGEARFLRALNYFNIVRLWGPAFKVTRKLTDVESRAMQRSSSSEIYDLIEEDLRAIVDNDLLPGASASADLGRATMPAAKALLAKVCMTRYAAGDAQYAAAADLLRDAIAAAGDPQSGADLVPYDEIFSIRNEMNAEILFAVRYTAGNKGLGSPFGGLFGPLNNGGNVIIGSPKHYNYPSNDLLAAFKKHPSDKRIDVSFAEKYWNATTGKWVTDSKTARYVTKFLSPVLTEYDGENDWPVIRLGDVLLLYAELTAELAGAPTDESVKYLNMTRERAGIPSYAAADFGSMTEFRTALREERRLELAFENQRWFDLQRWGTTVETVNDYLLVRESTFYSDYGYVSPIDQWQTMLPVPLPVININPDVAQNVGY
ncbi:MAG: RagB/SusD family nutrient uptake outer membrane protein [Alistipes sp.]|nr:RagB/SusD family nutrient uptake outer membrane protein [Alistipes sp.]